MRESHLPPGESGYRHAGMSGMLNVTMLRGLRQAIEEVDSCEVSVGDSEHILSQSFGSALLQSEIRDVEGDEQRDDVHRHPNVTDDRDPVGGVEDDAVVSSARLHLHILKVSAVDVVLGERLDG